MMTIACPHCGSVMEVAAEAFRLHKTFDCPYCHKPISESPPKPIPLVKLEPKEEKDSFVEMVEGRSKGVKVRFGGTSGYLLIVGMFLPLIGIGGCLGSFGHGTPPDIYAAFGVGGFFLSLALSAGCFGLSAIIEMLADAEHRSED